VERGHYSVPAIDQAANRATAGTVHPTIKKEAEQRSVHDNIMLALLMDVRGTVMWKKSSPGYLFSA